MTTREGSAEPESAGLTPVAVQTWLARIGADDLLGASPTRYIRRSGAEGIANYIPALHITTDDPGAFDEIVFWRPLPGMLVYALIRTPSTMARTPEIIAEYPSPYVVVGTQSMPGGGTFTQAGSSHPYRAPAHIVIFDNNEPYQQTSEEVADLAGVWIPVESLGRDSSASRSPPVVTGTPLACAAAAFIRNFAVDVAARGADVDLDTGTGRDRPRPGDTRPQAGRSVARPRLHRPGVRARGHAGIDRSSFPRSGVQRGDDREDPAHESATSVSLLRRHR
ncbi:AraC family transcriptional regulator [Gordonia polyisoprenivorans]|uniref:AraC family transcriptional regulator n=1 Tax=Gordonia polyisoprenivorans TaxID=84595 RepID=UPI001FCAC85D|nr:AraC family transcriptional regulator [Gordonia polyisoprenivorans]